MNNRDIKGHKLLEAYMKNKVKLGLIITAISLVLVGCNSNRDKDNTSNSNKPKFENSYSVLAEKIKGQNGEWPRVVISEPKNINAKEIAKTFVDSYDKEIDSAIIYIYEPGKKVTNEVEMHQDSKYTLDIFNESGKYTYELSIVNIHSKYPY